MSRRASIAIFASALTVSLVGPARAEPPLPVEPVAEVREPDTVGEYVWPARPFRWFDYAYTGVLVAGAVVELALPPGDQAGESRHAGGILFDDALHDEVVLGAERDRHAVATAADLMVGTLVAYPAIVPAAIVWAQRGSAFSALQLTMINIQAFAFTSLITGVTKRVADRERPIATRCFEDPNYDENCDSADNHYSFPSGHASVAFTGAALTCLHHFQLDLMGRAGDMIVCATGVTMAAFTGISRMASDKHYASDVLAGATIGSVSGALMPWLLYYGFGGPPMVTETSFVTPMVTEDRVGVRWMGLL